MGLEQLLRRRGVLRWRKSKIMIYMKERKEAFDALFACVYAHTCANLCVGGIFAPLVSMGYKEKANAANMYNGGKRASMLFGRALAATTDKREILESAACSNGSRSKTHVHFPCLFSFCK